MPCTSTLATIAKENCPSRPGLKTTVYLALSSDITTIGAAVAHAVSTITMVATKVFAKFGADRKDNGQESVPNENGGYTTTAKFFMLRQEAAKSGILTGMNMVENFVVITEDQNGQKDILGSTDHPVMLTAKAVKSPRNGYEVEVKWEEHADLPFVFTGTIPV